jgi:hypothetical protein
MMLTPFAFCGGAYEGLHMGKQKQPAKSIMRKKIFSAGNKKNGGDGIVRNGACRTR